MFDDADVLAFRGRTEGMAGASGRGHPGWYPGEDTRPHEGVDALAHDPLQLTQVVVIGDRVVDGVRRSALGSEYECAALEIDDERRRHRVPPPPPEPAGHEKQLDWLARIVGGADVLESLGTDPLPAEPLDVSSVSGHLRDRVAALDARVTEVVPRLLGDEALTAARRLLVRAVATEPGVLTRSDRDDVAAGAVVWAVGRGNDLVGSNRPVRSTAVSEAVGLRSSPAQRGEAFARAAGGGSVAPWWYHRVEPDVVALGDPGLLLSRFRRRLVSLRDLGLALRRATPHA
jgi:hypothetical protein